MIEFSLCTHLFAEKWLRRLVCDVIFLPLNFMFFCMPVVEPFGPCCFLFVHIVTFKSAFVNCSEFVVSSVFVI